MKAADILRSALAVALVAVASPGWSEAQQPAAKPAAAGAPDVVVHVGDLPASAFYELEAWKDPASPGGKMVGVTNRGEELDPPPENDPAATFNVKVQAGVPYRFWIHMKVGPAKGVSQANLVFAQFSGAVGDALAPRTKDYLSLRGPAKEGWTWVGSDRTIQFKTSGEVTVRVQAGAEGVGFDQVILSPARFLKTAPAEAIVQK